MKEKALNLLGLMRKANAAQIGETDTGAAARAQTAKLVVLASDASSNAQSRANGFVHGRDIPLITLPFTKQEISEQKRLLNGGNLRPRFCGCIFEAFM